MKKAHPYFKTCLVGGRHEPGSPLARECPELQRSKRAEKRVATTLQGTPNCTEIEPVIPDTSNTVFRYSRANKPGRPRTDASEQRKRSRERIRTWRAKRREA